MTSTGTHSRRLLRTADSLLDAAPRSAAFRRRAISSAYYAVFHALAGLCAKALLMDPLANPDELRRVYRSLDHGSVKNVFGQAPLKDHPELRRLGNLIVGLQSARLDADYQPPDPFLFPIEQARELIDQARQLLNDLDDLNAGDRQLLAVCLMFKGR